MAKAPLTRKGVSFTEYEISNDAERFAEMIERSKSGRTLPQIFIGDTHIGGGTELENIDKLGGIDPLLPPILE